MILYIAAKWVYKSRTTSSAFDWSFIMGDSIYIVPCVWLPCHCVGAVGTGIYPYNNELERLTLGKQVSGTSLLRVPYYSNYEPPSPLAVAYVKVRVWAHALSMHSIVKICICTAMCACIHPIAMYACMVTGRR